MFERITRSFSGKCVDPTMYLIYLFVMAMVIVLIMNSSISKSPFKGGSNIMDSVGMRPVPAY